MDRIWPAGEGEMPALIREFDWSATALGSIDSWPQYLRTLIDLVLASPLPMAISWRPQALHLYNDAYSKLLGDRHPAALGQSPWLTFPDSDALLRSQYAQVWQGDAVKVNDTLYRIARDDSGPQDAWFDVTVTPVRDEQGEVVAGLVTAVETTQWWAAQRQTAEAQNRLVESEASLRRNEGWLAAQKEAFQSAMRGDGISAALGVLCHAVTELAGDDRRCAFYIADRERTGLKHVVGMPDEYAAAVDGFVISPTSLSCGLAVATGQPELNHDVMLEPKWEQWRWLAEQFGFRACWSFPVALPGGGVVGSFALYFEQPREPSDRDLELAEMITQTAAIIISHHLENDERVTSEQRLRTVLEGIGEAFYALDKEWRFLFASKSALTLWGKRSEDLLGKPFLECFPQAAGSAPYLSHVRVMETNMPEHLETLSPVLGRWVEVDIAPTQGGGLSVALRDIDARKRAERAMRESEERFRSAVEVGKLGTWDWNIKTGVVHWSDEHFRMEGYAVGEVTPSYDAWVGRIHGEDREGAEAAVNAAMRDKTEFVREFRVVHPDGSVHWLYGRGRFFYDEAGAARMVGAMVDTTERREWEDQQKVLVSELQHRTRNLMGVVRAMADKTARTSFDLQDFHPRFNDRLDALARVQGLLSRLKEHHRVTFDTLIRTELAALGGKADRVHLHGPKNVRLRSSTIQILAMAIHELATNAVKYGALGQPDAQLSVTWALLPEDQGALLQISWRESGVVMPDVGKEGIGQGRELIERALPYQMNATTRYELTPDGVHCTMIVPVSATHESLGE